MRLRFHDIFHSFGAGAYVEGNAHEKADGSSSPKRSALPRCSSRKSSKSL